MAFDDTTKTRSEAPSPQASPAETEHEPLNLLGLQLDKLPVGSELLLTKRVGHPSVGAGTAYSDIIRDRFPDDVRFHLGPLIRRGELVEPRTNAVDVPTSAVPAVKEDNFGASPQFAQHMRDEMDGLPAGVRRLLSDHGITLVVTDRMLDAAPDLKGQHPRGWPDGTTWENDDGAFRPETREIMVSETFKDSKGTEEHSDRAEGVMRHETGHAVDAALGNYSQSADFKAAYDKDVAVMPQDVKDKLAYLLQANGAGQQETFAEVFAALNGGSANASQTALILQNFPNVAALVRRKLDSL